MQGTTDRKEKREEGIGEEHRLVIVGARRRVGVWACAWKHVMMLACMYFLSRHAHTSQIKSKAWHGHMDTFMDSNAHTHPGLGVRSPQLKM